MNKYLFITLSLGLLLMALLAFEEGKPTPKAPIYKEIQKYSPYYLEKRFGGLQIRSKEDKEFKEKPVNIELFRRLEYLEKVWAKKHLKIENSQLLVRDDNGTTLLNLVIKSKDDLYFLQTFYGL